MQNLLAVRNFFVLLTFPELVDCFKQKCSQLHHIANSAVQGSCEHSAAGEMLRNYSQAPKIFRKFPSEECTWKSWEHSSKFLIKFSHRHFRIVLSNVTRRAASGITRLLLLLLVPSDLVHSCSDRLVASPAINDFQNHRQNTTFREN